MQGQRDNLMRLIFLKTYILAKIGRAYRLAYLVFMVSFAMVLSGCFGAKIDEASSMQSQSVQAIPNEDKIITLSFIGDNVLGDYYGSNGETFNWQFEQLKGDYSYFFSKVKSVLENDDMTLGNLEGPLTTHSGDRLIKPFAFKGDPSYTEILKQGSVEAVNIANNHTRDYGMKGFSDTQQALQRAQIHYSGEGVLSIYEVKGVKIGMAGHRGWNVAIKTQVKREIERLREMGADIVIFTFHWGEERKHYPNDVQKDIGHFAIDNGADIVIGHHPHVLQGFEEYKGKKIIYSLGNFVYGGAKNPADKDSIIYQVRFGFGNKVDDLAHLAKKTTYLTNKKLHQFAVMQKWSELHSFVPVLISGQKNRNNYQPILAKGADKERIIERLETYSKALGE